jgi:hypothetical protein
LRIGVYAGTTLPQLQMVLGNKSIKVTSMSLHPSFSHISATLIEKSPLKLLGLLVADLPPALSPLLDAGGDPRGNPSG